MNILMFIFNRNSQIYQIDLIILVHLITDQLSNTVNDLESLKYYYYRLSFKQKDVQQTCWNKIINKKFYNSISLIDHKYQIFKVLQLDECHSFNNISQKEKSLSIKNDEESNSSFLFHVHNILYQDKTLIDFLNNKTCLYVKILGVVYQKYQIIIKHCLAKLMLFIENHKNSLFNEDFNVFFFLISIYFLWLNLYAVQMLQITLLHLQFIILISYILLIMEAQQTSEINQDKPQIINIQNTKESMKLLIQTRLKDKKVKLQNHIIQALLNVKQSFGPFSPKIAQFIVANVNKKNQANKVKKIYNQICLLPQLSSILYFNQQFLKENIDKLVELIQQKDQEKIIVLLSDQFKENQVQLLKKQIFALFSNQFQNYSAASDLNEKMIDENDQEIKNVLLQEQTNILYLKNLFKEKLSQKHIKIQELHLQTLIKIIYQFGAYSAQTSSCLQQFLMSYLQKKTKKKIIEIFNQSFKQIIFPKQVEQLLDENGLQLKQTDQLKQLIRQGDQQKLLKWIEKQMQFKKEEQFQAFIKKLLTLRNNQIRKKPHVSIYKIEQEIVHQKTSKEQNKIASKHQISKNYNVYKKKETDQQLNFQINSAVQKQQTISKKKDKKQQKNKQVQKFKNQQENNQNKNLIKNIENKQKIKKSNASFKFEQTMQNQENIVCQNVDNFQCQQSQCNLNQFRNNQWQQKQRKQKQYQNFKIKSNNNFRQIKESSNFNQNEQKFRIKNENHQMSKKKIGFIDKQSLQTKFIVLLFDKQCYNSISTVWRQGIYQIQCKNQLFQNDWLKFSIYQFKVAKNKQFNITFKYEIKQSFWKIFSSPKPESTHLSQKQFINSPIVFLQIFDQNNQSKCQEKKKLDSSLKILVFLICTQVLDLQKKFKQLWYLTQYFYRSKIIVKSTYLSNDLNFCRTYYQNNKKKKPYKYSDLGSKVLVIFFSQLLQLKQQLLADGETDLKQQIAYLTYFQTTSINDQLPWISQTKFLKQIMLNIMFQKTQNKHQFNQNCFLDCFQSCYKQKVSFNDHFHYLSDISYIFPQLCKKIYQERLKQLIGFPLPYNKTFKLTQFFILNMACLNVLDVNSKNMKINDVCHFQRKAIIEIFSIINNICENNNLNQDVIEEQNHLLNSFIQDNIFSSLLKEVLNGQGSHNKLEDYFLFSNEQILNLWLLITNIKDKSKIQFNIIFKNICGKQRLQKGFLQVLKSFRSPLMISFLLKHKKKQQIENLFNKFLKQKQIPYKQSKNMLQLIQFFYGQYYNNQNSEYFVQVFQSILKKNPKIQINTKQMLFLFQKKINERRQIQNPVKHFLNKILQNHIFNYLPGINQLKQQLEEVKNLEKNIKYLYLDAISQKITKTLLNIQNKEQTLQTKAQEIIYNTNSSQQDKHYILKKLFTEVNKSKDQIKKYIYKCLQQGSKKLKVVSYYNNFQKALIQVLKQIESKQIQYGRIKKIKSIQFFSKQYGQIISKIYKRVQQINGQVQKLKKSISFCIKIMTQYDDKFEKELQIFNEWLSQLDKNKIIQSIKKIKKYQQIFQFSEEIHKLMKIPLWNKDKIFNLKDLLNVRSQTIQQLQKLTRLLQENKLTYLQFKRYFNVQILPIICEKIEQKKLKDQVSDYTTSLQDHFQQKIRQYIEAINSLYMQIQKRQYFDKKTIQVLQNIANADQNYVLEEAYRGISYIKAKLKQIGFNVQKQTQIQLSILNRKKYQRVFELVHEKKIDSVNIISDLEEYVTDMEDSILKMEDIKQLQNICKFNEMILKNKSVKEFFSQFQKLIKNKEWRISQNIRNVDFKYGLIQQKIDQCANRQTSFKYDLAAIFKHSIFRIKNQNMAQIQIQPSLSQKQKTEKQATKYSYKKLAQFKDKALLLVIDYKKSADLGLQLGEVIQIFKKYIDLFKVIQEIHNFNQKVIIFGYNPNNLGKETQISEGNFQSLIKIKDQLKQTSAEWINGIQSLYDSSFMLTHFIGPNLNQFVQKTLEYQYNPILKQILQVEEKQFKQYFDSLSFAAIHQKQKLTPFEKVKKVCKLFQKYQKKILKEQNIDQQEKHTQIKKHIQLVSCVNTQDFYFALSKQKQNPRMNQVLYCQNQTSKQQIDIFLKRSMIKYNRKHYILGAHQLKVQVQLNFCDLLSKYLQNKQNNFQKSKLCFIDNSTSEKLYLHLCKQELFRTKKISRSHFVNEKIKEDFIQSLENTYLIQSRIAGLGKTFQAQQKFPDSKPIYFSVGGNISFSKLLSRLKRLNFQEKNTLIIQIGHIENKTKLQIFLFYICFFRGFNYKQFFFLPRNTNIVIQIQNVYQEIQKETSQYHLLKILRQNGKKHIFIKQFKIQNIKFNFSSTQEMFTFYYLKGIDTGQLNKKQQSYQSFKSIFQKTKKSKQIVKEIEPKKYIKNFFFQPLINKQRRTQPTFWLYKSFLKLLFTAFKTFSQNGCFNVQMLEYNHRSNKSLKLDEVRINFLKTCIKNCIQFLQSTINTNEFQENKKQILEEAVIKTDFRNKLSCFPFLIMPAFDFQNYQFVYLNSSQVDDSIKSMLVSQKIFQYGKFNKCGYQKTTIQRKLSMQIVTNLFKSDSLQQLRGEQLERQIFRILHQLSGNNNLNLSDKKTLKQFKEQNENIKNYSITLDNFFKMCLIVQRAVSHIPIIIMGESGVGKTALIRFLVQQIFKHQFQCFNIHAGVNQDTLIKWFSKLKQKAAECGQKAKVWGFFDEFNTTDQLGYIKQMLIDRRFQGQAIPDNIILLAACNPYRKKKLIKSEKKAGIVIKSIKKDEKLAFRVNPPPLSMIEFMWDYQQLQKNQNQSYIGKILQSLQLSDHQTVVETISQIHQYFKKEYEISSVSLRDVTRFKQLYIWFRKYMPKKPDISFDKKEQINPNYEMNTQQRAISLSLAFCYSLRIANKKQRSYFLETATKRLDYQIPIEQVVKNQQTDYVNRLKITDQKIAINFSLRQNVFTTLVCLINKIPILIIGNPGNSKSLSIRMISSNLTGQRSSSQFCKQFPQINMIYFQGSQTCTSKGIQNVFQKAIKSYTQFKKKALKGIGEMENCILFDQIGLAQKSIHNPLKVLHSELQTNKKQICFIGISNWELDAAKMSRFLVLSRSAPQKQQLEDTSVKILASYLQALDSRDTLQYVKQFKKMAEWYFQFINQWDKDHRTEENQGFFGLRDFYCYIKYVAQKIVIQKQKGFQKNIEQYIKQAIKINFDGQKDSVNSFFRICGFQDDEKDYIKDPIKLVIDNLQSSSSRCLLLIVKGDALIPIIQSKIIVNGVKSKIHCLYGSTFKEDQQSEQYNLQITSLIISHISRGNILAFKDINNSIQTSMYDLFNKSFTTNGNKKYCRIAVGANSNPKCLVHPNFNSIVFIDQEVIKQTDLAFLNRFQKHYLNLGSVLNTYQTNIVQDVQNWIHSILSFKSKTQLKKRENYLINSCQESLVTLVIKYSSSNQEKMMKNIKKALLRNSTTDFKIALKNGLITQNFKKQIQELLKQTQEIDEEQSIDDIIEQQQKIEDRIIYTYDQQISSLKEIQFQQQRKNIYKIRISQIKCQKQLRNSLKLALFDQKSAYIHIIIDYQGHLQHINMVIFLALQAKKQFQLNKPISIIIQLSRSSFVTTSRDTINISYLHKFEQCFMERISWKNDQNNFQQKSLQELYLHFEMEDEFKNIYTQAMKRFKLILNQDRIKFGTINQMQAFYFESAIEVSECDSFKRRALKFIYQNLSNQKINSTVFLNSKQDIKQCHNIQQNIQRYLKNKVINLICNFFQRIYKNNLLFCFNLQKTFQLYSKYSEIQVLRSIYQNQDQKYQKFLSSLIQDYVVNKELHIKQFNRKFQSNPLEIQQVSLFPMSPKDFRYILNVKQDSLIITGSKLLNLVVNKNQDKDISQQYRILLQKCNNIINQNSIFLKDKGLQKFSLQQILNENKNLQFFYFFDLINNLFSKTINSQVFPLERIVYLFVYIFRRETVKQKIIILALSQQLWSYIFNIWSLWIVYNQKNFHKQILQFYSDKFLQGYSNLQLPYKLIQICKYTLQFQQHMFFLNSQNIHKFGMNKYLQYFRKTYYYNQKLRIYCMEMDIQVSQTLKATKRFFDLLDKILDKQQIEQSIAQFISIQQDQFQGKVQIYLNEILIKEELNKNKINLVITYLSLDIYSAWIQRLLIQKQQSQLGQITNEMKTCFETFFKYANIYEQFANNSTFFLQQIFNQFSQFQQVQEKIQYLRDQANDIICLLQNQITFENNISVALGNFLMNDIENMKQSFEEAQQAQFKDQMNEGRPNTFVSQYLNLFKQFIQQQEAQESNVFRIYKIQFCKIYLHQYLRLLDEQAEPYLLDEIDKSLCKQNKNTSLLKLYLLKVMLYKEKKMNNIKNIYLIPKKCRWLEIFRQIIQGKSFELLVPPNFQQQQKILQMINEFRSNQYQDFGLFENILKQSFVSPFSKYQFLTFMMNDIYTRSCPQDRVLKILQIIQNAPQYSQQNQIQLVLLKRYCHHQINTVFKYEIGHQQLKIQQFVEEQLIFINYLNILVSCSKSQCPLIQMFFNNRGHVPNKYFNWLQQRFLILGKENLSCSILNGILQRNDVNSGYYRCSSYCDFFYVIGGTGYGCKNPSVRSTCPWCKKGLGGVGDRLDRINQGAQKYQIRPEGTQLTKIRQEIRQKKRIQVLNLKLNGYGYSPNHHTLLKQIQENNRISYSPKALMQQMFLTLWAFLIESKLICQDDVLQIFKDNSQSIPQKFIQTSKQFNKDLRKKLNFEDQSSNIIWHLGISKEIMKFIVNYKRSLSQQKQSWMGLVKCKGRDMFQQQISKLILNFSNGKEKQDLVNRSRTIKSGVNLSGQQIVRQNDCYQNHLDKYPQIRMIKLIHKHKSPSYKNLISEYGEIIQRDYPILSYCIMKQEKIQKLIVFRKMYLFISKLIKTLNYKITRKQASVKSITKIISDILNQDDQIQNSKLQLTNQWKQQIFDFCNSWNQLRQEKFQLQYDCHNLGSMDQTTIKLDQTSPAVNFLPDNKYKGDQKGQMLLSLLQVSARQYNVVCTEIQNIRKSNHKYRQAQIFNPNQILPTQVQPLIRTLEMSAQRIEEDFIFNFSAPSVQYGVSLPHYSIDKIQSLIVQNMVGSHIINEQIKEYDIIHYIGEQTNFINQFRNYNEQISWENVTKNQEIESFIYTLKHSNPDAFIKEINSLKGSLQKIMMYYKYKKIKLGSHQQSLGEFIRQNEMMLPSRQIQKELFSSLPLSSLLSVYQFVQVHTLQNSSTQLNQSYKKERMTQKQLHILSLFKETIKQKFQINQNIIYHISVALYRFVCRNLLLVQINEERILYDYISEGAQLWPKQFDLQRLKQQKYFQEAFSIKLSKIGHLLQLIPLQLKKTKAQLIMIDTERQVNNPQRKKPQTLNQASKLNKKKKNI